VNSDNWLFTASWIAAVITSQIVFLVKAQRALTRFERACQMFSPPSHTAAYVPSEPSLSQVTLTASTFHSAHSRASIAVLTAVMAYAHKRLHADAYGMGCVEQRALAWLLKSLEFLPAAIAGDPRWGSSTVKECLVELDGAIAPGSWWQASQGIDRASNLPARNGEVPHFAAVYDAAFGNTFEDTQHADEVRVGDAGRLGEQFEVVT
jgi:hypothetical protein